MCSVSDITPLPTQPHDDGDRPPEFTLFTGRMPSWTELSDRPDGLHVEYWDRGSFVYVRGGCGTEVAIVDGNITEARLDSSRRSRFMECPPGSGTMAVLPNEVVQWLWTGTPQKTNTVRVPR